MNIPAKRDDQTFFHSNKLTHYTFYYFKIYVIYINIYNLFAEMLTT